MRGVIKDFTDSKRSEILLRDSEERYEKPSSKPRSASSTPLSTAVS